MVAGLDGYQGDFSESREAGAGRPPSFSPRIVDSLDMASAANPSGPVSSADDH